MFENRVLRRIFGPRGDEIRGEWRNIDNEEHSLVCNTQEMNDLYSSPNIVLEIKSRRMRWAGNVACMGDRRGVYKVSLGKPEGKKALGKPRRRWKNNIKMDLQEVGCEGMDWIELAQDRDSWRTLVNVVMNIRVP